MIRLLSTTVLAASIALFACERRSSVKSGSAGGSSGASDIADVDTDDPVAMAKEIDKIAAEDLAESKIPAQQWLAAENHKTFEARKLEIVKFTNATLAAGAVGVWVSGPEALEGVEYIDTLYIELPADKAKRAKILQIYNKINEGEQDPEKDLGQKFLVHSWG